MRSKNGLTPSTRLLNEAHRRLMKNIPGHNKRPGENRQSQNRVGGTRPGNAVYVPPPPHLMNTLLHTSCSIQPNPQRSRLFPDSSMQESWLKQQAAAGIVSTVSRHIQIFCALELNPQNNRARHLFPKCNSLCGDYIYDC